MDASKSEQLENDKRAARERLNAAEKAQGERARLKKEREAREAAEREAEARRAAELERERVRLAQQQLEDEQMAAAETALAEQTRILASAEQCARKPFGLNNLGR